MEFTGASNGTLYVADDSCNGHVWKNGGEVVEIGDQVEGITISKANPAKISHLYFATTGSCIYGFAFIFDYNDKQIITPSGSPFTGPGEIPAMSTTLQFVTGQGDSVFSVKDKS